ncbi:MAG: hypothetical protein F2630_03575 [Actinobacteria bacterium]|nr:hypothetical protein [Actinomycetota bacterium]
MPSTSRRSVASQTNRLIALVASFMLVIAIGVSFIDSGFVDPDASLYRDPPDPEYLRVKSSPYPFKADLPSRDASILPHAFNSGIFQTSNQGGMDQPKYISNLYPLSGEDLTCSGWFELHACAIGESASGNFLILVSPASQSANTAMQVDSIDVDVLIPIRKDNVTYVSTVLQANFQTSRCNRGPTRGSLQLDRIKVGKNDVFVLSIGGDFLDLDELTSEELRNPTQEIVIAANSTGMPEIVASYAGSEMSQIAATNRSLLLTYSDGWQYEETPNGFTGANLIELIPNSRNWRERIHRITSMKDPFWIAAYGIGMRGAAKPNLVKPKRLLDYSANLYPDPDNEPICAGGENE